MADWDDHHISACGKVWTYTVNSTPAATKGRGTAQGNTSMSTPVTTVPGRAPTGRSLAILRAVAAGRAQLTLSREPDLLVDGIACCDQFAAHMLVQDGLITSTGPHGPAKLAPATLTRAGTALLASAHPAA